MDDLRNAITWLSERPEVDRDRIGAWGVSLGGGHVMHLAAFDRRIKAVAAMIPAINQFENFRGTMGPTVFAGWPLAAQLLPNPMPISPLTRKLPSTDQVVMLVG